MDWHRFWEQYPQRFGADEFLRQVGRTANGGRPTPESELQRALAQVVDGLDLRPTDRLLDLCCGNGLLTRRLAEHVAQVVGVDFSEPMLEVARSSHGGERVAYRQGSVLDLEAVFAGEDPRFDKVCLLESLHYFQPEQLPPILRALCEITGPDAVFYFSGVTDAERKWAFFDTDERRAEHARRVAEGTDVMGHWWHREEIEAPAAALGLRCEFLDQDPALNTAHYRFDVRISRTGA